MHGSGMSRRGYGAVQCRLLGFAAKMAAQDGTASARDTFGAGGIGVQIN
jgi:hypothetical protein